MLLDNLKTKISIFFGLCSSSLLIFATLKHYFYLRKYKAIPGPKFNGLIGFFIGNVADFNEANRKEITNAEKIVEWSQKFGPIFKFQAFGTIVVLVNDADAIREILIEKNFPKMEIIYQMIGYPFNQRFIGKGILTETDHQKWKQKRSSFNQAFHKNSLLNYMDDFNLHGNILMEKLRGSSDGKTPIVLLNEINRLTLDIIAKISFGLNINAINDPNCKLNYYITKVTEGFNHLLQDPFLIIRPTQFFKVKEYKNSIKVLRNYAKEIIENRFKDLIKKDSYETNDLLSILLSDKNNQLDIEESIDEFLTFFVAGQETTANSIAACLMELGRNPEILNKLRKEIDEILGEKTSIGFVDLNKLEYLDAVFKETLRKWPPGAQFSKKTTQDISIKDYKIPKNTWILISPLCSGFNEKNFPEPERFLPERFIKETEIGKKNTFSLGPRNCIGQHFAKIEAKIIIAKFVQKFNFKLDPNQSFGAIELVTFRPKDGCRVYLTLRD